MIFAALLVYFSHQRIANGDGMMALGAVAAIEVFAELAVVAHLIAN